MTTAKKKQALILLFLALAGQGAAFGGTVMLSGTFAGDTRYDVNKNWVNDDGLCWAAEASNMINYWQDAYVRAGNALPAGTPSGGEAIFQTFRDNWTNATGYTENGLQWWFDGRVPSPTTSPDSALEDDATGGAYYKDVFDFDDGSYVFTYACVSSLYGKEESYQKSYLKGVIDACVANDTPMGLSIYELDTDGQPVRGHGITLWGYDYDDATGDLTGLWLSDSDDYQTGNSLVGVEWNESDEVWYLQGFYGEAGDWGVHLVTSLDLAIVPEPAAVPALFGAFAAALFLTRRRRSRGGNAALSRKAP